jgi:hypothetical protein
MYGRIETFFPAFLTWKHVEIEITGYDRYYAFDWDLRDKVTR